MVSTAGKSRNFKSSARWIVWLASCYLLVQLSVTGLIHFLPEQAPKTDPLFLTVSSFIVYGSMLFLVIGLPLIIKRQLSLSKIAKTLALTRRPAWGDLGRAVLMTLYYFSILFMAMFLLMWFLPDFYDQKQNLGFSTTGNSGWQMVLIFFSLVVMAPIAEELLMRGWLFGKLRQDLRFWPATVIVSLLFALAHGQLNVALDTFILSLFLCTLREKTGAIYAPILVHMLKNLIGFLTLFNILAW
jgi:membrane protease YdiL (CAAX protease family)